MKTLGVLLILGGVAAGLYHLTRKAEAKKAAAAIPGITTPPDAMPAPPVTQVVDQEDPPIVDISGYNYGSF